jgi:hypothetical protein
MKECHWERKKADYSPVPVDGAMYRNRLERITRMLEDIFRRIPVGRGEI